MLNLCFSGRKDRVIAGTGQGELGFIMVNLKSPANQFSFTKKSGAWAFAA
jgi:hypothetical protein